MYSFKLACKVWGSHLRILSYYWQGLSLTINKIKKVLKKHRAQKYKYKVFACSNVTTQNFGRPSMALWVLTPTLKRITKYLNSTSQVLHMQNLLRYDIVQAFWHELRHCSWLPFRQLNGNNVSGPLFLPLFSKISILFRYRTFQDF